MIYASLQQMRLCGAMMKPVVLLLVFVFSPHAEGTRESQFCAQSRSTTLDVNVNASGLTLLRKQCSELHNKYMIKCVCYIIIQILMWLHLCELILLHNYVVLLT